MQKHIEREHYRKRRYSEPGAVEIGLIKAGDDLLDEVAGGAEMASLSEQQRRLLGVAEARPNVEDRLEIAVYPVVSRHFPKASLSLLALRATMRDFCTQRERERERRLWRRDSHLHVRKTRVRVEDLVVIRRERWHRRNSYIFLFKNASSLLRKKIYMRFLSKELSLFGDSIFSPLT
jgi:hypothetical protein